MAVWTYNSSDYTARNFELIPEGDHRVMIKSVEEKMFSSGNEGFEITLDVSGYESKLWYRLVLDHRDPQKTNQRIGMFFDSFAIRDVDLSHYEDWVGRDGAVRVKHNMYNGKMSANVIFCLSRSQQTKFPDFNASPVKQQSMNSNNSGYSGGQQNRFNGFQKPNGGRVESFADFNF